jgi:acyl carrier protein
MESNTQIEQLIFNYIDQNTHADINNLNNQTLLFKEGIFDSMGFVLLIDYLEEKFGIRTDDTDLTEENFESVSAITNYIQRKKNAGAA